MGNLLMETEECIEARVVHVAERPITFARFLKTAPDQFLELVDGVIVEKPMVQLDHELCSGWLHRILGDYVEERSLGRVLTSRIMVQTSEFSGRMPDLLFVRQQRLDIVQQKAVYGAPDLIIEIVSPNDRPSDLRALEADYFRLGVPELVFIDLRQQEIRLLHRGVEEYAQTIVTSGPVTFAALGGLPLEAEWILREPRPGVRATLNALFPPA